MVTLFTRATPGTPASDLINIKFHEHNDLKNIMSSSMLFGKDPRLALIRIPETATEETLNPNPNSNPNSNPNDLINIKSHELNGLLNIMSPSMLFLNDPRLAPIMIKHTATEEILILTLTLTLP